MGEEDWDSDIEIEEVEEEENRTEFIANVVTEEKISVNENESEDEDDIDVEIEEVKEDQKEQGVSQKPIQISCKFCLERRFSIEKYPKHLEQVHGKDPEAMKVTCRYCKERVFSIRLHRHVCSKASKQCPQCKKKYWTIYKLNKHIKTHELTRNYKCQLCALTFCFPHVLKRHMLIHDSSNYQECQYCNKRITKRYILRHEKSCKELQEGMKAKSSEEIKEEIRIYHQERYRNHASCRICSKPIRWCYYIKHLKDAHNTKVNREKCSYCEKRILPEFGLKDHEKSCWKKVQGGTMKDVREEQESRCEYCDKEIKGEEGMEEHKVRCWEEVYGKRD